MNEETKEIDHLTNCSRRIGNVVGYTLLESCRPEEQGQVIQGIMHYVLDFYGVLPDEQAANPEISLRVVHALKYVAEHDLIEGCPQDKLKICLSGYTSGLEESVEQSLKTQEPERA